MKIPNKEQIIYSQMAIVDGLFECNKENMCETEIFDDDELNAYMELIHQLMRCVRYKMQRLMKDHEGEKNVCY